MYDWAAFAHPKVLLYPILIQGIRGYKRENDCRGGACSSRSLQKNYKKSNNSFCYERRPYTTQSGCTPLRTFVLLLKTGNLTAHMVHRLMLLGSPPDMVHGSTLRKTHSSTQKNKLNSEEIHSQAWNPPLL